MRSFRTLFAVAARSFVLNIICFLQQARPLQCYMYSGYLDAYTAGLDHVHEASLLSQCVNCHVKQPLFLFWISHSFCLFLLSFFHFNPSSFFHNNVSHPMLGVILPPSHPSRAPRCCSGIETALSSTLLVHDFYLIIHPSQTPYIRKRCTASSIRSASEKFVQNNYVKG